MLRRTSIGSSLPSIAAITTRLISFTTSRAFPGSHPAFTAPGRLLTRTMCRWSEPRRSNFYNPASIGFSHNPANVRVKGECHVPTQSHPRRAPHHPALSHLQEHRGGDRLLCQSLRSNRTPAYGRPPGPDRPRRNSDRRLLHHDGRRTSPDWGLKRAALWGLTHQSDGLRRKLRRRLQASPRGRSHVHTRTGRPALWRPHGRSERPVRLQLVPRNPYQGDEQRRAGTTYEIGGFGAS